MSTKNLSYCTNVKPHSGWGTKKAIPTNFNPVTSTKIGISSQNFLTFSFNPFSTLALNFKAMPSPSPKLFDLNQKPLSKNWFFWSNPYKIEVMITSLIEMLELPNFGQMTKSTVCFESLDKIFAGDIMGRNYDVITFISKYLCFKKV